MYWAELAPRSGSEQQGRRPVIVVSHDGFNETPSWRSVIIVPMSTFESQARPGPTAVEIARGTEGIRKPGVALCHQVMTLDRSKLTTRIGVLPDAVVEEVDNGLRAALNLIE